MISEDEVAAFFDAEAERRLQRTRDLLYESGRPDLVEDLDRKLKADRLGITHAQSVWYSISPAQRRLIALLGIQNASLRRCGYKATYLVLSAQGEPLPVGKLFVRTIRSIERRGLLEWTGGSFDPEISAVPTEHLRFVLHHGPRTDIPNPWTKSPPPISF